MRRDDATLLDLLKAARLALVFVGDATLQEFLDDPKTQSAVFHQLLLLGEGAKRLSVQFRDQHSQVPWKHIAGMRDKLIHEYDTPFRYGDICCDRVVCAFGKRYGQRTDVSAVGADRCVRRRGGPMCPPDPHSQPYGRTDVSARCIRMM